MVTKVFDQMINYSLKNNINTWLSCGDFLHRQEDEKYNVIIEAMRLIKKIKDNGIILRSIKGNHDRNSWRLLKEFGISFIPDGHSIHPKGHFELCHYVPKESNPFFGDKTKPIKSFDRNKIYFLGHWHQPTSFQKSNLCFVGSLIPERYGTLNEVYRCRFIHFDSDRSEIKYIYSNTEGKFTLSVDKWLTYIQDGTVKHDDFVRLNCKNQDEIDVVITRIKELNIKNAKIFPVFNRQNNKPMPKKQKIPSIRKLIEDYGRDNGLDVKVPLETLNSLGY